MQSRFLCHALLSIAFVFSAGTGDAADPSAPARDNVPRIWKALTGDRLELDGQVFSLRGVTCPSPERDRGRQAKALLNTFLLGSKHSRKITCSIFNKADSSSVDCRRRGQMASVMMVDSGLCQARSDDGTVASADEMLTLTRHVSAHNQISSWRLRTCIGVHPAHVPTQCRLASRTWPLRYAEAARWLERQRISPCPTGIGPARSGVAPRAGHAPPNRYSLRPFLHNRCHSGFYGH